MHFIFCKIKRELRLQSPLMNIHLRSIQEKDFYLLKKWQNLSHVAEVWGNPSYDEPYEQFVFRTNDGSVEQFIIEVDGIPIGYFQFYWASQVGGGWWESFDDSTVGIDFYIGEPLWLGKGIGQKVLEEAKETLFANSKINRIIADPSPTNARIIHLLKKAGFESKGEIETPDGKAILLELKR